MSRADVDLIQQVYARWNAGELDRMLELIDPGIVWRPGTDSPFAGTHTGIDGYEQYVRSWAHLFESLQVELGEIRAHGEWLMGEQRQISRPHGGGVDFDATVIHAWRVENGKVVRWCSFRDEEEALEFLDRHA